MPRSPGIISIQISLSREKGGHWGADLSDDQTFHVVWYVSLILLLLPLAVPLARSQRQWLRNAGAWVLIGGFLFAFYRIGEWLLG